MKKNIVAWDVETTGLSPMNDHIIQLAMVKFDDNFTIIDKLNYIIKPPIKFTIDPRATKVHGYTEEFIKENGVELKSVAQNILDFIKDCDYLTYNGNTFDIQFIVNDLKIVGYEFPIEGKAFYDSYAMECRFNPRNLSAVYKKYTNKELTGAHDAFMDVLATIEVFKNQLKEHNITKEEVTTWPENTMISPDGSIRNAASPGDPMKIVFVNGKYKNEDIYDVAMKDRGYFVWWYQNVASEQSKKIASEYGNMRKKMTEK